MALLPPHELLKSNNPQRVAHHVVKVFAVRLIQRAHRETDLIDPLLSTALKTEDSIAVLYAGAFAPAPELRFRRVDLPARAQENNPSTAELIATPKKTSTLILHLVHVVKTGMWGGPFRLSVVLV